MDTIRVDISYRPLRIGWAIQAGDIEAFRRAVRLSYALWGGRFNPILIADNEKQTKRLVDLFRVDVIWPIGDGDRVNALSEKFPYLISPFFSNSPYVEGANRRKHAQVLDVQNTVSHLIDRPDWQRVKNRGVRLYTWQPDDPLADLFLVQFGGYPSIEETCRPDGCGRSGTHPDARAADTGPDRAVERAARSTPTGRSEAPRRSARPRTRRDARR